MSAGADAIGRAWGRVGLLGAVATGVVLALLPGAAFAHAVFASKTTVPANSDQKVSFYVPEEKGPSDHNAKILIVVPGGFTVGACDPKPGWSCAVAPASQGRTTVTYDRAQPTTQDERGFGFAVHTPSARGNYPFPVNQYYSDHSEVRWSGAPDSDTPAPVLSVD